MKIYNISWLLLLVLFSACSLNDYDNYDSPESTLQGAFVYQGDSVRVSSNDVTFELWQSGFGQESPINVTVDQNGSYSAALFNGDYRLVVPAGQGPFISNSLGGSGSDTLDVQLNGNQKLDIEVTPYYMIRDEQFSVSGRTVSVDLALKQVVTGANSRDVEFVELYISTTNFVDVSTSISSSSVSGGNINDMNNVSLSTDVPEITPSQDYVFARVGVKVVNVEDMVFSSIERIQLN